MKHLLLTAALLLATSALADSPAKITTDSKLNQPLLRLHFSDPFAWPLNVQ